MDQQGPAKRTRSLTGVKKSTTVNGSHLQLSAILQTNSKITEEAIIQNLPNVKRRSMSGSALVCTSDDIRNFFSKVEEEIKVQKSKKSASTQGASAKPKNKAKVTIAKVKSNRGHAKIVKVVTPKGQKSSVVQKNNRERADVKELRVQKSVSTPVESVTKDSMYKELDNNTNQVKGISVLLARLNKGEGVTNIKEMKENRKARNQTTKGKCESSQQGSPQLRQSQEKIKENRNINNQESQINVESEEENQHKENEEESEDKRICTEPEVMDLKVVVKMFQEIKKDMETIKENKCKTRMDGIEKGQVVYNKKLQDMDQELQSYKLKTEVLTGVVKQMSCEMEELKSQMERVREENMRNMVTVSGFEGDPDNEVCKQQIDVFLQEEMGIEINIIDLFQMVTVMPKTVVLTVGSKEEKAEIFKGIKNIKHLVNSHGKKYFFFRDYLPRQKMSRREEKMTS